MELHQVYKAVLESMKELVYVRDLDMNIMYINPASEKLTGWPLADALGKKCYEVFGDEKLTCKVSCPVEKVISGKIHISHSEGKLKTLSGDERDMRVSISPLCKNDTVVGAVVVMEDISELREFEQTNVKTMIALEKEINERKKIQKWLQESEEKVRSILNASPSAIVLLDRDGIVLDCNKVYPARFGMTGEELIGKCVWDLFPTEVAERRKEETANVFVTGEPLRGEDERQGVWNEYRIEPAIRREGEVKAVVVEALEITERKRSEEALKKAFREKQEVLRELQHRVKNSFAMITSMISLAENASKFKEAKFALSEIGSRVRAVYELYDLLYSSDSVTEVRLDDYCARIIDSIKSISGNITFKRRCDVVTSPVKVAATVGIIFVELITNSIKHAFPANRSGTIAVILRKSGTGAVIDIKDDGIGFPEGFDISTADSLGLKIIHALAGQIDGSLKMERGDGTRFVMEFPIEGCTSR